jgi:DNA (cytosine-5)-methyltransferase 1
MRYLSVCSGIEAATVAWHDLGWQPVGFSKIEPFPSAVLAHHYPGASNLGDMTNYKEWNIGAIDLVVGGTPCQSFSVAGLRKGLEDPRGNLALVYCGILDHFRPQWCVWENVPGVLSSNGGRDFGSFLGALAELGYGFAYRVLDAQYFGVAQRRRRVFVVGYFGDWQPAAKVLFESESLRRDTAPSREKGQSASKCLNASPSRRYDAESETMIPVDGSTYCMDSRGQPQAVAQSIAYNIAPGKGALKDDIHVTPGDITKTLDASGSNPAMHQGGSAVMQSYVQPYIGGVDYENNAHTMDQPTGPLLKASPTGGGHPLPAIATAMQVRRLTPVECERLQGFPDNYTEIPWRGKTETPDGPRYKALGNSMAVPVMQWIGGKINAE